MGCWRSNSLAMSNPMEALSGDAADHLDSPSETVSFESLVRENHAKLFSFIYRYTKNRQDAVDFTQGTFVKAFRNFHRYDSKYPFASWLFTIGRRIVFNHFRRAKKMEPMEFDMADGGVGPDAATEESDTRASIWEAAKSLKKDYREALVLKYVEGLSIEEIARVLNKTKSSVKIILFRARNQLKKIHKVWKMS